MKVLWITNILLPEVNAILTGENTFRGSGGWLISGAEGLVRYNQDVLLYIATVSNLVHDLVFIKGEHIGYYVLPKGKGNLQYNSEYEHYWKLIKDSLRPDIIHIHGTEFSHGLAFIKSCGSDRVVVSIQGVLSEVHKHYYAGVSKWALLKYITVYDIYLSLFHNQWKKRVQCEFDVLIHSNNVIGRTQFDKAHVFGINPQAHYFHCNELMREEFYEGQWCYKECKPHSIFLSQATYPLKGAHQILKAMPYILRRFPDTTIRIAGADITKMSSFKDFFRVRGYGRYLRSIIKELNLSDSVKFLGALSASEIKEEYLSANVFICPSAVENSSNSISEAQMLGVPIIATYTGGIPSLITCDNCGKMYPFDDVFQLAFLVCDIFENSLSFDNSNEIKTAKKRHDKKESSLLLHKIYSCILNDIDEDDRKLSDY